MMALRNWEIAVYALFLRGGASASVDTEDVALKCFELAPASFSWVKHREYPDKDIVRVALTDARKERLGGFVTGRAGRGRGQHGAGSCERSMDGWRLTERGARWIAENEQRLVSELDQRQPKSLRQELLRRLSRVRDHHLFREFKDQPESFVPSLGDLAELLRCRVDAEMAVWGRRFAVLRNQAQLADQKDVCAFVDVCQRYVESRMEGS